VSNLPVIDSIADAYAALTAAAAGEIEQEHHWYVEKRAQAFGIAPEAITAAIVRTPEGAAKYDQPIGSTIVKDLPKARLNKKFGGTAKPVTREFKGADRDDDINFGDWTDAQLEVGAKFADRSPNGPALLKELEKRKGQKSDGSKERAAAMYKNAKKRSFKGTEPTDPPTFQKDKFNASPVRLEGGTALGADHGWTTGSVRMNGSEFSSSGSRFSASLSPDGKAMLVQAPQGDLYNAYLYAYQDGEWKQQMSQIWRVDNVAKAMDKLGYNLSQNGSFYDDDEPVEKPNPRGVKYPGVEVRLVGEDGNAYAIMGRVSAALKRAGASPEEIKEYMDESMSGDYDNLLRTAMKWVEVS
jgi:hypothetical protein